MKKVNLYSSAFPLDFVVGNHNEHWRLWLYHGGKSSIAQKAQNCQIHSEMEEKIFTATAVVLPRPWKYTQYDL